MSTLPAPGSWGAWLLATRPATLVAAAVPVAVGAAAARVRGPVAVGPTLAALIGALLLQIAANLANDVFDFESGADTADRLGPTRAAQAGLLTPRELRVGLAGVLALALAVGVYLTWACGAVIVLIGLGSIATALAYTGGPYPLGYHGLGDVAVALFFGLAAVTGTAYVASGSWLGLALWASLPVGALATALLVVNNLRDRETDLLAGKRTLAVRWGRRFAIFEYRALLVIAYAVPVLLAARGVGPSLLLPLVSLPVAWRLFGAIARAHGRALNAVLLGSARLLALHGFAFAFGIAIAARG